MTIDTYAPRTMPIKNEYTKEAYWRLERQLLQQEFTDITMEIILAGGAAGADALPAGLDVLVDWDVFNEQALNWMRRYLSLDPSVSGDVGGGAYGWASQLTETTRQNVIREIDDWVREGAELPVLEARLRPLFGEERARRVAVTEVTRVYAQGNQAAWEASGLVGGKRWQTANDERVCPICGPMHGKLVDLTGGWNFTQEMLNANPELAKALKEPTTVRNPPAHVNCRCWLQPVIFEAMEPEDIERQRFGNA